MFCIAIFDMLELPAKLYPFKMHPLAEQVAKTYHHKYDDFLINWVTIISLIVLTSSLVDGLEVGKTTNRIFT